MPESDVRIATLDPDGGERFQRLRPLLGVTGLGINLVTLQPRQRMRVHLHERQEEVYVVLEGELTLIVEGDEHRLGRGQLARVGPSTRRQLVNAGTARVAVLVAGASVEHAHESRDARTWGDWDEAGEGRSPQDVPLPQDLA